MPDRSTQFLIAVNLINIVMAIIFKWSIYDVMLVYWFQSVSIGIFTFYKLYSYPIEKINQEMEGGKALEVNDLAVTNPIAAKIFIAGFFALHYGFFHLVYIIFIVGFASSEGFPLDLIGGLVGALLFFANHFYSYLVYKDEDNNLTETYNGNSQSSSGPSIADLFSKPYTRIIPIHLTIIAGGAISHLLTGGPFQNIIILLFFMGLKTLMDVIAHKKKHKQILFAGQDG
ncbi:MAG: hypothetical protein FJ152_03215 [Firmicutes bacterium]|nr:hypothetical protein [Bacillota bacterium]